MFERVLLFQDLECLKLEILKQANIINNWNTTFLTDNKTQTDSVCYLDVNTLKVGSLI